jgi:predicted O-linked N-acetylglucosamine transferase (SPINDLY family)
MPEASEAHDRAFDLNPNLKYLPGERLHTKQMLCDWSDYQSECRRILDGVKQDSPVIVPFSFLSVTASPEDQLRCARSYVAREIDTAIKPLWNGEKYSHERIRVAYLSPDFREHPTSYLMAGLFESHDRNRFETMAISFIRKDDPMQRRLHGAFDRFVDASELSDGALATMLREAEVDIAVDLAGFTRGNRIKILAARPAPIQVNYLGYPGSMGAGFIDYLIADEILIPDDHASFYSEAIVRMPHTYQVTDDRRVISAAKISRRDAGLPENGFVFCSFNNCYKINPEIFDIWMRLLRRVENSVLWLIETNAVGMDNLRREARNRGISPERIVFAPKVGQSEHLGRHRLADLFLDTLPYNAHTTASDALWAGLPIVTCLGSTFAARVAASILKAIDLPELVTDSLASYEALALKLAEEPNLLQQIRAKIADNRQTQPLFNTRSFTADLEQAYSEMWRRSQAGHPPKSFRVRAAR